MRVGIVTWYGVTNYGSALQSYALQRLVAQAGHDCVVLRHPTHEPQPPHQPGKGEPRGLGTIMRDMNPRRRHARAGEARKTQSIAEFRASNLILSERFIDEVPVDLAIIGSDQIFDIGARFHPFQFGSGVQAQSVATYAPSFGETHLEDLESQGRVEFVRKALLGMRSLSARDHNTKNIIDSLTGREILRTASLRERRPAK